MRESGLSICGSDICGMAGTGLDDLIAYYMLSKVRKTVEKWNARLRMYLC